MNILEQDTEVAVLLEWDAVHALQLRVAAAARAPEKPEKLIARCAKEDQEEND